MERARGSFTVTMTPETAPDVADGTTLGRLTTEKRFEGDLEGTSRGTMLTALTEVRGSAGYVLIERVTGRLHGRSGSFVLQHHALMTRGAPEQAIVVVPDSGSGELAGITGSLTITITAGKHFYELTYTLGPAPASA